MNKKYFCVPSALIIPATAAFGVCFFLHCAHKCFEESDVETGMIFVAFAIAVFVFLFWCWDRTMWKVQIRQECAVVSAPLCKDIVLEYDKCTIGVDYHLRGGGKVWWIYLCYGPPPKFESSKQYNRMNSLKCKQGFIRIMYRKEIYDALLEVLPKKQKTALVTSARCAKLS